MELSELQKVAALSSHIQAGTIKPSKLSSEEKRLIERAYAFIEKKSLCSTCPDRFYDGVMITKIYLRKPKPIDTMIKKGLFQLKPGAVIKRHGSPDVLTNDNLTDEKAINLLKTSKANIKNFSIYPPNWMELLGETFVPKPPATNGEQENGNDAGDNGNENGGGADAGNTFAEKIAELKKKERPELITICEARNFPVEEYSNLGLKTLRQYIANKD